MKIRYTLLFLLGSLPFFAQQTLSVEFNSGAEIFPENFAEVRKKPAVNPEEVVSGYYVRYLQCAQIPTAAERKTLETDGVQFLGYVRFGAYLVALPQNFDIQKLGKIRVQSVISLKNEWKTAQNLREQPFGEWALHGDLLDVNLQVYPHVGIERGAELCRQFGMTILVEGNQNGFLQVRFLKENLDAVAALPWVQSLELVPPPSEPDDTRGRSLHRSNGLDSDHALDKKYNGEGVSVLVRDDGPLGPHVDYQGRLYNLTESGDNGTHGDGVGGIFAGAGNLDPTKKGMAAGANVYAIRYTPEFQDRTLPLHLEKNVTITNSSYSNGCNAGYTLAAQTVDQQIFEHPTLMHVFSAGNSNNISTCISYGAGNQWGNITGGHKMAKNAIATANLYADAELVLSSSRGPAYDGRLKPDIAANGQDQESTDHDNSYLVFGGTSGAAPGIAGCLAQLTHAFKILNNGQHPESALLKATILNTANDLGNKGPDFKFGWGQVNAARALRILEENRWLEGQAEQDVQAAHTIQIPTGVRQARFMVYWADPPTNVSAAKALLNDLDLTVTNSADVTSLPWKLNPTPNPDILNTPAGNGRDSLNNTEQVALENPTSGAYTIKITGTEVPFGPQQYFLVWEFLTDEVKLTYPIGGEGFVPGEVERIHWDAYGNQGTFSLRYSTDNGFSWNQIADVSGDKRMFDWQVPNLVNGRVRLLIQHDLSSHMTEFPLSIAPLPTDIQIEKVCPNSMTVSWKSALDTLSSDVYLLGNKYVEIVGTTPANTFTFPVQNGGSEKWVSVRASHLDGLAGRRAIAVQWPGELKNCTQPDDLALRLLQSPSGEAIAFCSPSSVPVTVKLKNEGLNAVSGAMLNYQVNDDPVVSQVAPTLNVGDSLLFTFQTPIYINENEEVNLKTWSNYAAEDAFFNDTLQVSFPAVAQPQGGYFAEGFQGFDFPPFGWRIVNPDESFTWQRTSQNVTGANGQPTRALLLNCYFYNDAGQEDYIDLIPVDLGSVSNPGLSFQIAHAQRNNNAEDLRVEIYPACDLSASPVVVWQKSDPELSTIGGSTTSFTPNEAEDWRAEVVNLNAFAGQSVIIRFVATNDIGNNIYLDDIGIIEYNISPPVAALKISADTTCVTDTVLFEAIPSGGNFTNYEWVFGQNSIPSSAFGIGPHAVRYLSAGNKNVRLIAWNTVGADTIVQSLPVIPNPLANFSAQLNGLTASFANSSQNAVSYLWDFGDGAISAETNPVHIYAAPGTYSVKLSATNYCRTNSKTLSVPITSGVEDLESQFAIRILPNPTTGDFRVEMENNEAADEMLLSLFDAQGRLVKEIKTAVKQGFNSVSFENLHLPKGVYQLNVQTERGWQGFSVVVQ